MKKRNKQGTKPSEVEPEDPVIEMAARLFAELFYRQACQELDERDRQQNQQPGAS